MTFARSLLSLLLVPLVLDAAQVPPPLVFIAPTNHSMPMARFENGELVGGLLKDLGELIARRMGRRAVFVSIPSRRVSEALSEGRGDAVCYVLPRWIQGNFRWSQPLIPNGGMVVARSDAPVLHTLADLADKPVGTIVGYRYPEIEAALGSHFIRDDAPTMDSNFRKLDVGRMQYAVMEQATLNYRLRTQPRARLRAELGFNTFKAQCAFSQLSRVPFEQADEAINGLLADGSIQALLDKDL
jgi:polar amino acid transport system substrate-binding protein